MIQKSKSMIPDRLKMQEVHSAFEPLAGWPLSAHVTVGVFIISLMKPFSYTENSNCGKQETQLKGVKDHVTAKKLQILFNLKSTKHMTEAATMSHFNYPFKATFEIKLTRNLFHPSAFGGLLYSS